ncbi:YcxB family protein [Dactylosporangium aurantiacum]|uniref:YcxB family protein n=1 Tax=Dactylosporangium aurantiacum TaxID=35754 RepID=A0A9Q9IGE4_9ACTN|nr:YcxB family protein [Dactylosporangium aurantiacum]MDG6102134.1 YcxB family protein [Dactylosporangium aurantiacum]UWZ53542.1 YcxB family protein [Dactylosporangium aurantiacum]
MHISFTVEPDPARARRAIRTTMGGKLLRLYILGAVVAGVGVVMSVNHIPSGAAPVALGAGLLCFPWLVSRAAAQARTGMLGETVTYELTDADVQAHTRSLNVGYRWESVQAVRETPEFWVLTVAGINPLAVPWKQLPAADAAEVRAFLVGRGLLPAGRQSALGI